MLQTSRVHQGKYYGMFDGPRSGRLVLEDAWIGKEDEIVVCSHECPTSIFISPFQCQKTRGSPGKSYTCLQNRYSPVTYFGSNKRLRDCWSTARHAEPPGASSPEFASSLMLTITA